MKRSFRQNLWTIPLLLTLMVPLIPGVGFAQSVDRLFEQGIEDYQQGRYREAEAIWRRVIELESDNAVAHYNLGLSLRRQDQLDEAIVAFRRATQIDPSYDQAYFNLGLIFYAQGQLAEAEQAYRTAVDLNSNDPYVYNNLGLVLYLQGDLAAAVEAYRAALAERNVNGTPASAHTLAYVNLGDALRDQGQLDEAAQQYQQAIDLDRGYSPSYSGLGTVLLQQQRFTEAIEACERALSRQDQGTAITTAHTLAHTTLGEIAQQQGNLEEAIMNYQQALEIDPDYETAQTLLQAAEQLLAQENAAPPSGGLPALGAALRSAIREIFGP